MHIQTDSGGTRKESQHSEVINSFKSRKKTVDNGKTIKPKEIFPYNSLF